MHMHAMNKFMPCTPPMCIQNDSGNSASDINFTCLEYLYDFCMYVSVFWVHASSQSTVHVSCRNHFV